MSCRLVLLSHVVLALLTNACWCDGCQLGFMSTVGSNIRDGVPCMYQRITVTCTGRDHPVAFALKSSPAADKATSLLHAASCSLPSETLHSSWHATMQLARHLCSFLLAACRSATGKDDSLRSYVVIMGYCVAAVFGKAVGLDSFPVYISVRPLLMQQIMAVDLGAFNSLLCSCQTSIRVKHSLTHIHACNYHL